MSKSTYEVIVKTAREKGWEFVRETVYGNDKDVNRNSHETVAMQLFIDSRMFGKDILKKLSN